MKALEIYGRAINRAPWAFVIGILVITGILGFFIQNFEMGSDEEAFALNDEVSQADRRVREEYGSQSGQLTVLFRSDENVLNPGPLNAMLDLEEAVKRSDVQDMIIPSPNDPDGILSPAEIVIQSIYYNISLKTSRMFIGDTDDNTSISSCLDNEKLMNTFIAKGYSLTMEEKRAVVNGGVILVEIECLPSPLELVFPVYDPSQLPGYTRDAPMAKGLEFLLSRDYRTGSSTAGSALFILVTEPDLDPDKALEVEEKLQSLADTVEEDHEDLRMLAIGDEIVSKAINEASGSSMMVLGTMALVAIILVLVFVFRSAFEIVVNVAALFMAIIWVFGVGGILGFENNPSITTVPVLVIGLGIDYGIHMTLRYREELRKGKNVLEASTAAEASVGFAILLATVTTLVGFLSNVSAGSEGIRVFGILNATGIFSAFVIMITFVPAARVLRDRRRERLGRPLLRERKTRKDNPWGWTRKRASSLGMAEDAAPVPSGIGGINKVLSYGTKLAVRPIWVILAVIFLTGIGIYGAVQLEPTFDFRDFLPDGVEVSEASKSIVSDFDFSSEEGYVLVEGDVSSPDVFRAMDDVKRNAMEGKTIVSSEPISSPMEMARDLSSPASPSFQSDFNTLWHSNIDRDFDDMVDPDIGWQNVTAVYDALFLLDPERASRVLRKDTNDNYVGLVIRIPVNTRAGELADEVVEDMIHASQPMEELDGGELDRVTATGNPLVQKVILDDISSSQARSVIITFAVSLVILTVVFMLTKRALFLGLVTLLPLIMVIAWTLGGMYFFDIPLNVVTVTISAITVGLGIDYGVHISSRFMEDLDRIKDGICALTVAVSHTGSALFGSALTTVIGFAILSFAIIPPLAQFGQVTALSVMFAFLASVFVLPTFLLLWLKGNQWYRRKFRGEDIPDLEKECKGSIP
ncbi:MAG: MMPL family transporter [Candidatus Thermoplasmatota archaeon]|nr:MMPL family transporter [Candidatus Thermoplasmatota archaeon]